MSKPLHKAPQWQRERALILQREFANLERLAEAGAKVSTLVEEIAARVNGRVIVVRDADGRVIDERPIRASAKNVWTLLKKWRTAGRTPEALLPGYQSAGSARPLPELLRCEVQRRASLPTGGRDKHGRSPVSVVYKSLCRDWIEGKALPGVGTWRDWWANDERTRSLPLPSLAPEFPWCEKTIRRHAGSQALRAAGNIGAAAAMKHQSHLTLNYAKLRRCELYTLDDVRLDVACIDRAGNVQEAFAYVLMEVASRSIVAVMVKPGRHVKAEDVDELIARGLSTPGYGIGVGYQTHIRFERGSVACSEGAQRVLEEGSGGRIKIHRTSMDGGTRWVGAPADRASGHAAGKAVIESWNKKLHYYLLHLPGQRGNTAENSPANLGIEDRGKGTKRDSLTRRAEALGRIRAEALAATGRAEIELPMLPFERLRAEVEKFVMIYNQEPGQDLQGHTKRTEIEVAPGVWHPVAE